ncbi:hypothetical protein [Microbacterium sp. K2]|uniref:hypothetical protein n=1 Tax=Microbacterium sp. K2 TaxID=3391827 RepID=UPI003ED9EB7B
MAKLIGSAEAAIILGIDRSVFLRRVKAGSIVPVQKLSPATGAYLFDRDDIEQSAPEDAK